MRYDAAIIGAGTNGLAAAATLARAGLNAVVLERAAFCGGRAVTREFHPGFRASPFVDELAPIPAEIMRDLDLARHGAIFAPSTSSLAIWPDRRNEVLRWTGCAAFNGVLAAAQKRAREVLAKASSDAAVVPARRWFSPAPMPSPWPGEDCRCFLSAGLLEDAGGDEDTRAHLLATALSGRSADPFTPGSALYLHLLARQSGGMPMGGLATLSGALEAVARSAGAEILFGLEVADIALRGDRAVALHLADGTEIEARAIISTLDQRRTFFSLFAWRDLPQTVERRVSRFRYAAGQARLLLALDAPPECDADFARGPIHIAPDIERFAQAHDAWHNGIVPEHLPLTLRLVSAVDPGLAPAGKAVLTATIGCIPHRRFDGAWTNEKRVALREQTVRQIDTVLPGVSKSILGSALILPPDIEQQLGITEGDLDGGEIAPDQMFAERGFAEHPGGRTPIRGLYLGGMSSPAGPLGTCAAGVAAARAVIADLSIRRFL
ncbi:MAG: NAD(P)/FAD-dependent oxidoreductase [Rhizomicrobium sp.]